MGRKKIKLKNLWYYQQLGLSFAEIGRICGCSKQAVWVRLKRFQNSILYDELSQKWMKEILEKSSSALNDEQVQAVCWTLWTGFQ